MFSDSSNTEALKKIINDLNTSFSKDTLKICVKKLEQHKIVETEPIKMGVILSKCLQMNGIPKHQFMIRLNRIPSKGPEHKHDRSVQHLLTMAYEDLLKIEKFTDASENIRMILLQKEDNTKECQLWLDDYSERLIQCITSVNLSTCFSVQLEHSCYTIAILTYKHNFIFGKYFKQILIYLLMIVVECSSHVQEYFDQRNEKWNESHSMSFDQDSDSLFHYPLFVFQKTECRNRLLSVAYFTLAFCFDCVMTPPAIISLMLCSINLKEISRFHIVSLFHDVILSIDKHKCKSDLVWQELPLRIHNEIIKFYADKNPKIRELIAEINVFNKQCSYTRLPFITKPVLDTVDIMMDVIKKRNKDMSSIILDKDMSVVTTWTKLLDLEKKSSRLLPDSDSGDSISKKSYNDLIEDEKIETWSRDELTEISYQDMKHSHIRSSFVLPDLTAIMGLTKLRTKKLEKRKKIIDD